MTTSPENRRAHERYDTNKLDVRFDFAYEVATRMNYQFKDEAEASQFALTKFSAVSKNISTTGIGIVSSRNLPEGERLYMELFLPHQEEPIVMEGEVRWCRFVEQENGKEESYEAGIQLLTINSQPVEKSIYMDNEYKVPWSVVLETVFGNYRMIIQKKRSSGGSA